MISIVIPLYNKEKVVRNTLLSVQKQSFTDYEVILVNDGSTDNSLAAVEEWIQTVCIHPTNPCRMDVVRIITQSNQGVAAARNRGIAEARGEIVAFLDADDEWEADFLETIDRLVRKYPACAVFGTAYALKMENDEIVPLSFGHYSFEEEEGIIDNYFTIASRSGGVICSSAVAVRKSALVEVGGFPVGIYSGEDLLTWARLSCRYLIAYSKKIAAYYNRASGCYVTSSTYNSPSIQDDYVGHELKKLANQYGSKVKDLNRYVSLWCKMRFVTFVWRRQRKRALAEYLRMFSFGLTNLDCWYRLFLLFTPRQWGNEFDRKLRKRIGKKSR